MSKLLKKTGVIKEAIDTPENVLVVDTSTSACCLAIKKGDELTEDFEIAGRSHSEIILPKIKSLLERCHLSPGDLQLIVFGQGPGSFTGLRIAVGVVQGLSFGLNIPLTAVSGLACLAQGEYRNHGSENILVAMAARQTEVYWAAFQVSEKIARPTVNECVVDVAALEPIENRDWVGVGEGWELKKEIEQSIGLQIEVTRTQVYPQPLDILELGLQKYQEGEIIAAEEAQPVYLRETFVRKIK